MAVLLEIMAHLAVHQGYMWLWTHSVRNHEDLATAFDDLGIAETRFRKADHMRKKRGGNHFGTWIKNWIGVYEVKRSEDQTWNVHAHKIVVADEPFIGPRYIERRNGLLQPWGYNRFNQWWGDAAGDPASHSDFEGPTVSPRGASNYVAKYVGGKSAIWGGLTSAEAVQYGGCLRGRRFLRRPRGSKPPKLPSDFAFCCETISPESCWYESR